MTHKTQSTTGAPRSALVVDCVYGSWCVYPPRKLSLCITQHARNTTCLPNTACNTCSFGASATTFRRKFICASLGAHINFRRCTVLSSCFAGATPNFCFMRICSMCGVSLCAVCFYPHTYCVWVGIRSLHECVCVDVCFEDYDGGIFFIVGIDDEVVSLFVFLQIDIYVLLSFGKLRECFARVFVGVGL